jgi:hypothetical protein
LFDDGTANDAVGQKHLINPSDKVHYTSDRFGAPSSALALNQGYMQAPPGSYLAGAFTVTFWIYLKSYASGAIVFRFGDSPDNVLLYFSRANQFKTLVLQIGSQNFCDSYYAITLNSWKHVTVQYDNYNKAKFYVNGNPSPPCTNMPANLHSSSTTIFNYIGNDNALDAVLDDLKFYNRVLMDSEIQSDLFSFYSYTQSKSTTPKSYFGCYVTTTGRDGLLSSRRNDFSLIKVDTCRQKCKDNKYLYAALKNGYQF